METTTTRQRAVLRLDYDVNTSSALSTSPRRCDTTASDPFSILNRVCNAKQAEDIVLHVHGFMNSIAVAHLMTLWRECTSRGAHLRVVLLNHQSLQILKVLGLGDILDARLCPDQASNRVSWDPPSEITNKRRGFDTATCGACSNAKQSCALVG